MTMKKSSLIGKTVEVIKVAPVSVGNYAFGDKGVVFRECRDGVWIDVKFEKGKCHTCYTWEVQVVNEENTSTEKSLMEQEDTGLDERIQAWNAVFDTLKEVMPNFTKLANTGTQCAVQAIKILAEAAKAPDIKSLKTDIEEIRQSKKKLQEQMQELDEKEAALIAKLKEHGFVLAGEENVSATGLIDMTDPKNWKVGDFFTIEETSIGITQGKPYEITHISEEDGGLQFVDDDGDMQFRYYLFNDQFKFHSRPKK